MDFTFSEDQLLFQESVRDFLVNEVTPAKIRELWETDSGRSDTLWSQLAELGLTGMTVPEKFGGLGMDELDFVLLAQECGYVALPEPVVHMALVAVPLLREKLHRDTVVIVDDGDREDESRIVSLWKEKFGLNFTRQPTEKGAFVCEFDSND